MGLRKLKNKFFTFHFSKSKRNLVRKTPEGTLIQELFWKGLRNYPVSLVTRLKRSVSLLIVFYCSLVYIIEVTAIVEIKTELSTIHLLMLSLYIFPITAFMPELISTIRKTGEIGPKKHKILFFLTRNIWVELLFSFLIVLFIGSVHFIRGDYSLDFFLNDLFFIALVSIAVTTWFFFLIYPSISDVGKLLCDLRFFNYDFHRSKAKGCLKLARIVKRFFNSQDLNILNFSELNECLAPLLFSEISEWSSSIRPKHLKNSLDPLLWVISGGCSPHEYIISPDYLLSSLFLRVLDFAYEKKRSAAEFVQFFIFDLFRKDLHFRLRIASFSLFDKIQSVLQNYVVPILTIFTPSFVLAFIVALI